MSTLPSRDAVESFTRPEHKTNMPRGSCPSTNKIAPAGNVVWWLACSRHFNVDPEKLQKNPGWEHLHSGQLSMISNPYGVFTLASTDANFLRRSGFTGSWLETPVLT